MSDEFEHLVDPTTGRQIAPESVSIAQLVEGAKRGYRPYIDLLYRRCRPAMLRVAGALARDQGDEFLEDVLTDAFMQLPRKLATYREEGRFEKFLAGVVFNIARTKLRARVRERNRYSDLVDDAHSRPPSAIWRALESDLLVRAAGILSDTEREVFILAHEGWTISEIAAGIGIRAGAVSTRLSRARGKVRQALGGDGAPTVERDE
ncbi:MAG: sigma-70 family RNA polymerase sigma factor [Gemmatimonadaceae bacterium]|nr:sigma-70 family RNA polymerase sigma factor [Gemmatimonadaceae bacterium]